MTGQRTKWLLCCPLGLGTCKFSYLVQAVSPVPLTHSYD